MAIYMYVFMSTMLAYKSTLPGSSSQVWIHVPYAYFPYVS